MKKTVILLLAVALVVVLLGVMIIGQNNDKNNEANNQELNTKQEEVKTIATAPGWSFYNNGEAGFSLSFPEKWTFMQMKDEKGNIIVNFSSPEALDAVQKEADEMGGNYGASGIDFTVTYSPSLLGSMWDIKNFNELFEKPGQISKLGEIDLNGTNAIEAKVTGEGDLYEIFAEKDGRLYEISFNRMSKGDLTEVDKKIISTFRIK